MTVVVEAVLCLCVCVCGVSCESRPCAVQGRDVRAVTVLCECVSAVPVCGGVDGASVSFSQWPLASALRAGLFATLLQCFRNYACGVARGVHGVRCFLLACGVCKDLFSLCGSSCFISPVDIAHLF